MSGAHGGRRRDPPARLAQKVRLAGALALLLVGCGGSGAMAAEPEPAPPPPAPDYADPGSWAALPDRRDGADVVPPGEEDRQADAAVDVFFVHPTTHFGREWNAAIDAPKAASFVDEVVLPHQAAAFNGVGRVHAPRYRQASIFAFATRDFDEARAAMDLAYSDVLRAFDAWASESDRPVVLAAHSQGSYHALRLLADRFETDPAMRERLVAAYLVGMPLPTDVFTRTIPGIPPCAEPEQTGCVLSWNTVLEGARPRRLEHLRPVHYPGGDWESTAGKPLTCTNPLGPEDGWAPREAHAGGVLFVDARRRPIDPEIEPALTRARCIDGVLEVERDVPFDYRRDPLARQGDLHLADYPLFFMDIRRDVARRAGAHPRHRREPQHEPPSGPEVLGGSSG